AKHFDRVARSSPGEEIVGQRSFGVVNAVDASDLLDQVAERCVHEVLIQLAVADAIWKSDLSHFTRNSGAEPQYRSDEPLGEGKQIPLDGHSRALRTGTSIDTSVSGTMLLPVRSQLPSRR